MRPPCIVTIALEGYIKGGYKDCKNWPMLAAWGDVCGEVGRVDIRITVQESA